MQDKKVFLQSSSIERAKAFYLMVVPSGFFRAEWFDHEEYL